MTAPMPRSKWKSVRCQEGHHDECKGIVYWVNEKTKNRCPCKCHLNPGVSGEGDSS